MKVCQVDTCVISDVLEDKTAYNSFIKFIVESDSIIGLSTYNFYELFKRKEIYDHFLEAFPPKRIVILKSSEMLLKEEMNSYINPTSIEPILIPPTENFDLINKVFSSEKMKEMYAFLDNNKGDVLEHILALKHTYPPNKQGKYSKEDRIEFVNRVSHQQLEQFYNDWYKSIQNETLNLSVFKSLSAQLYITFYKFYIQKHRKPRTSDLGDISLSASFPYVDFVLTEKNLVNDIQQIQKQNMEFNNTIAFTLTDIKKAYV